MPPQPFIESTIVGIQGPPGSPGTAGAAGTPGAAFVPPVRTVAGAADTPTLADHNGLIVCTSATPVTITVNDLGANKSYAVQQRGAGQVTLVAGAGVTLQSAGLSTSFKTARRRAFMTVLCEGDGNVGVSGDMA